MAGDVGGACDELEQAVLLCHDPTAAEALRHHAHQYCEQLKQSAEGWLYCTERFVQAAAYRDETRFMCLQVIEFAVRNRHDQLDPQQVLKLRELLLSWLRVPTSVQASPPFIKNKMALIFGLLFVAEFPAAWPTFFIDLKAVWDVSPHNIDFYLRVLMAIDVEVVDRDFLRSALVLERNSRLKDAMRELALPFIVNSWHDIFTAFAATPLCALAADCLGVAASYISWIDISLVATEQFLTHLFVFMSSDSLREGAVDCFIALVSKGMDPVAKIELLDSLNLIGFLQTYVSRRQPRNRSMRATQLCGVCVWRGYECMCLWCGRHRFLM
eukprot:m.176325 g.176325  ORF g.176325 m.176325 type:complete len:327 (-) comp17940_c0_seq2:2224-3204(-)